MATVSVRYIVEDVDAAIALLAREARTLQMTIRLQQSDDHCGSVPLPATTRRRPHLPVALSRSWIMPMAGVRRGLAEHCERPGHPWSPDLTTDDPSAGWWLSLPGAPARVGPWADCPRHDSGSRRTHA
jgi:hypothetical protein